MLANLGKAISSDIDFHLLKMLSQIRAGWHVICYASPLANMTITSKNSRKDRDPLWSLSTNSNICSTKRESGAMESISANSVLLSSLLRTSLASSLPWSVRSAESTDWLKAYSDNKKHFVKEIQFLKYDCCIWLKDSATLESNVYLYISTLNHEAIYSTTKHSAFHENLC